MSSPPSLESHDGIAKERGRVDVKQLEEKPEPEPQFSPREIQGRFDLLRGLGDAEMEKLGKRVLKKIDMRMMPAITMMFLMCYLDRINVSNARLAGMQEDLHMTDTIWNLGISAFYIGYLVGQLPGNLWLAKASPRWFLPCAMLGWSALYYLHASFDKSGIPVSYHCEVTSSWYTKQENPTRMAIWHAGNTISNIISGFLAAGILTTMSGVAGLHSWQWFFLIEGIASIVVALGALMLLPNYPHNTRFLTPAEREMAQYRVLCSNGGKEEGIGGTWDGVKEAVKDPFTWFFCLMHFALIVNTFDLGELTTYFIQAPPYAFAFAFSCAVAWSSGRRQESFWHIVLPILGSAAGCAVLISTTNVGARYFGLFLLISGTYNGLNLQLSWETTLKAALIAIANCISQVSHWFSPYFWPRAQEPFYRLGGGLVLVGCLLVVVSAGLAKWRATKLNRKMDEAEGWLKQGGSERGWRYVT
ncbi:hypothetical protein PG997_001600 [Apiospora hydei]|uniref:Uncharacterized protein n=1 Tax=Apiospora hydei TaxID=1337664 RepID=A0ABR1XDZ3_9PEZI